MTEVSHTIPDLLETIKEQATLYSQIYPDRTVQIQIHPTTLGFIEIWMAAQPNITFEKESEDLRLFGYQLFKNNRLKGRYAIAVLEEEEQIWR